MEEEEDDDEGGGANWMATFSDMATLLLTFFILLLSFANLDTIKFRMALGSVRDALGVKTQHPGDKVALSTSPIEFSTKESAKQLNILNIQRRQLNQVRKKIKQKGQQNQLKAEITERGIVLRVKNHVLFPSGKAQLGKDASGILDTVIEITNTMPNPLMVEGHTDNRPITGKFASNWELSAHRAIQARKYIVAAGNLSPTKVGISGFADTKPIASNDTDEGKKRNRRVEFVFVKPNKMDLKQFLEQKALQESKETPPGSEETPKKGETTSPDTNPKPDTKGETNTEKSKIPTVPAGGPLPAPKAPEKTTPK